MHLLTLKKDAKLIMPKGRHNMRYTNIKGNQESIKVAKIVLGVSMMGSAISKELSFEMLDYYVSVGGNTFDTAIANGVEKYERS